MNLIGRGTFTSERMTEDIIFIVVFTILAFLLSTTLGWRMESIYRKQMADLLLNSKDEDTDDSFDDITSVNDFWKYLNGRLIDDIYGDASDDFSRKTLHGNVLAGVPRLRQVRVRESSCRVPDEMRPFIKQCFGPYNWINEVESSDTNRGSSKNKLKYFSAEELGEENVLGEVARYYGGGVFSDFSYQRNITMRLISDLEQQTWVDRATRAVFLDFNFYNVNLNIFCAVRLLFEFPTTGGVLPSAYILPLNIFRYQNQWRKYIIALDINFILMVSYLSVKDVLEIRLVGRQYFRKPWNYLNLLMTITAMCCILTGLYRQVLANRMWERFQKGDEDYIKSGPLITYHTYFTALASFFELIVCVNLFKYIKGNKIMHQLMETLNKSSKDVAGFTILFSIVFLAFSQLGYLIFGTVAESFSSFKRTCITLLLLLLGDFDYGEIKKADAIFGPVFFLVYVFVAYFMLLNIFLAIINDTYSEVKAESSAS